MGYDYQQERAFNLLDKAAANEGSAADIMGAGMGFGMGINLGNVFGGAMGGAMTNIQPNMQPVTPVPDNAVSKKIKCSICGASVPENAKFCPECGNKIALYAEQTIPETRADSSNVTEQNDEIEKKLEEVAFYYQLSGDKREDINYNKEPFYYLKAQDILVDLSQIYPEDYRIWWELCKPIDFHHAASGDDIYNQYGINEDYFERALDKSDLQIKRKLIEEHDRYIAEKKIGMEKAENKRREEEARLQQEEVARQKFEQQHQEEIRNKQMAEQQEQLRIQQENVQKGEALSASLWQKLVNKDYQAIDNSFFNFLGENNQTIIGIFKNVSNVMYLMAFHIDGNKGNTVYRDQTISIKFDGNGHGIKFDNTPVRIRGMLPQQSNLFISSNGMGSLMVNGMELRHNAEYVASIMKNAKKPLFAFTKYFY